MSNIYENFDEEILKKIQAVQDQFSKPGADGASLFIQMRELLLRQSEMNFEEEIKDHPHGMPVAFIGRSVDDSQELAMMDWIKANLSDDDFVLMPQNASGKYKEHWNWIYFRRKDQAMLFKLTWL